MEVVLDDRQHDSWRLVVARGELDLHTSKALERRFADLIEAGDLRIALDMREVSFMDSSTLGILVTTAKTLREQGGHLVLVGVSGTPAKVLSVTRMDQVIQAYPTAEDLPLD